MPTPVFDASGRNGTSGRNGAPSATVARRPITLASRGQNGLQGSQGSPGEAGTPGGLMNLQLLTPQSTALLPHNVVLEEPAEVDVLVKGDFVFTDRASVRVDTFCTMGAGQLIALEAKGGHGGQGGNGGRGQNGGPGARGRDATRHFTGRSGGSGGKGGDGGAAGKGGDGQSGGTIRLNVTKEDTHLLVFLGNVNVPGGTGGQPGTPGKGGNGGPGGKGGSPYTYSTDGDGMETSHTIRGSSSGMRGRPGSRGAFAQPGKNGKAGLGGIGGPGGEGGSPYTTDRDGMETSHTIRGGSSGMHGRPGSRGAFAQPGKNGKAGLFSIIVADGTTDSTYKSCYDLCLQGVRLVSEKEDGVFEPGSRVFVSSIEVLNTGGMPTPTSRSVLAYIKPEATQQPTLDGKNWVVSEGLGRFVQLPPALKPNEPVTVLCSSLGRGADGTISAAVNPAGEYLSFRVAHNPVVAVSSHLNRRKRGAPFRVTTSLIIRAQMTPLGRDFVGFVRDIPLDVSYPVHVDEVASLPSLPLGGRTLVKFSVTNSSLKDYGRNGEIGREVMVKIAYEGGDVDPSQVAFTPLLDGAPLDPVVFGPTTPTTPISDAGRSIQTINLLPAGATVELTGWLAATQSVEPYTMAKFSVNLLLGEIDSPLNVVQIQRRDVNVCLSKVYKKTPGSATLLVTNNQTTKAETEAWAELAVSIFGNTPSGVVDIWDVSQEGHFDLRRVLQSGSTLCDDWKDGTIVILDNHFEGVATQASNYDADDCALNYLDQDDLVSTMVSHGVHFCIISPLLQNSVAQLTHLSYPQKGIIFTSSHAHETLRALLDPFSVTSSTFIMHDSLNDFITTEIDVPFNGAPITPESPYSVLYTQLEHIIPVNGNYLLGLAAYLQKQLLRKHPQRRYAMSICTNADELQSLASQAQFTLPPRTEAAIRVRRSLDVSSLVSRITLTASPASPVDLTQVAQGAATIHTPAFIKSPQVTSAFLQSIPFLRRVEIYAEALMMLDFSGAGSDMSRVDLLKTSILADLACEQAALRLRKQNHGVTEDSMRLMLPRLTTFCSINLPSLPADHVGRKHLLDLVAVLTAYMKTHLAWYELLLSERRSLRVTKISSAMINDLMSRIFPIGTPTTDLLKTASNRVRQQWKKDVARVRGWPWTRNAAGRAVRLKGRAFAEVLGGVAGGKIEWYDEASATSIAGSVCTEFGMFFTPRSFLAAGPYGSEMKGVTDSSRLCSVTQNEHAIQVSRSGTRRRDSISSRVAANHRSMLDFTPLPPI